MSYIGLREKFSMMCLYDRKRFPCSSMIGSKIFSEEEILHEPLKWLKYIVMDRVGLETISKISSQINRFYLSDLNEAKQWVYKRLSNETTVDAQCMIIAKVVPWDSCSQLKNYRIYCNQDVEIMFQNLLNDFPDADHELWCCESPIGKSGFNIGGRINYPKGSGEQILEIVWFASPRFIENVQIPAFEYPYLRAQRDLINPEFKLQVLHIPEEYRSYNKNLWMKDFQAVARELEIKRIYMEVLIRTLIEFGAGEVCFCFKMAEGLLTIIDWDTEIESTAR